MKTRAAYIKAPWNYEIRTVEIPDVPPPGQARIKVDACGLCGTDIATATSGAKDWQPFGHEIAGTVEAIGENVTNVKVGDKVALESASSCGVCDLCRDGRIDLCAATGPWNKIALGFSERMMTPAVSCVPYDGLSPEVASMAEPSGVAFDMVKIADIQMGDSVAVVGPGPIALSATALAVHRGAARVTVIGHSHSVARLALAKKLGAEALAIDGDLDKEDSLRRKFNHVLMTAPIKFIAPALSLLAYDGRMTYIGIGHDASGMISFDANDFHFRKLQLRASFASPARYFPAVIRLMKAGVMPGADLISHTFTLDQLGAMLDLARTDKATTLKLVMTP
ncbi:MAG: alcohol dehydrogenase catalytic domain-containing protein [Kiritimatiellaeota bacterium]|nr:alcohol dehydrogenase catalytic domain-containing protein [Kiritimatiellota bacterium]